MLINMTKNNAESQMIFQKVQKIAQANISNIKLELIGELTKTTLINYYSKNQESL